MDYETWVDKYDLESKEKNKSWVDKTMRNPRMHVEIEREARDVR